MTHVPCTSRTLKCATSQVWQPHANPRFKLTDFSFLKKKIKQKALGEYPSVTETES